MSNQELRRYKDSGRGPVEIGSFKREATWTETGSKYWYDGTSQAGGSWIEGDNAETVEFQIDFGEMNFPEAKGLLDVLKDRPEGKDSTFSLTINGRTLNSLYLHRFITAAGSPIPRGVVLSNEPL